MNFLLRIALQGFVKGLIFVVAGSVVIVLNVLALWTKEKIDQKLLAAKYDKVHKPKGGNK